MTAGGFAVLDTGPSVSDGHRFSGVSYIRGPPWLHMPFLTIGLLGISIVWSVEMAYASPYLLSLGLSKSAMAVVFVAGPLSGLIMQPIIGILADGNTSRWGRRRPYMIFGTVLCVFAMSLLGWTKEIAGIFASETGLTLWLAVLSVYLIDFSVNAVMAVDRALLVDILPATLQPSGNAWAARMGGFGSVVGYFAGNLDLPSLLPIFGHTELQILSVVVSIVLLGSHILVAASVSERVLVKSNSDGAGGPLAKSFTNEVKAIFENLWSLPRVIRQIFLIQFFAWISWFPIMFYSTLYIGDLYKRAFFASAILVPPPEISEDSLANLDTEATRIGSRALFYSSLLTLAMNVILPFFTTEASESSRRRKRALSLGSAGFSSPGVRSAGATQDGEVRVGIRSPITNVARWWKTLAIPEMFKIHLVSLWTISQGVLAFCMLATFFTTSVAGGTALITVTGFSWAITQWAPFALLGEAILTEPPSDETGAIHLVDTRQQHQPQQERQRTRRGSSESQRELALLSGRRQRQQQEDCSEEDNGGDDEETIFVPGHASDSSEGNGAEVDGGGSVREERKKMLSGVGGVGTSSANVMRSSYNEEHGNDADVEYQEDDEDVDEAAVLVGRRRLRDEEQSDGSDDGVDEHSGGGLSGKAGIILGIHNIFIVMPQFLVTGLSSIIFALVDPQKSVIHGVHSGGTLGVALNHTAVVMNNTTARVSSAISGGAIFMLRDDTEDEVAMIQDLQTSATSNSIVYIFRIGGISALIAFILCWRLARELRHR
ncbi:major facilitator superfamily domain-containing protein [Lentinula aciculospora]|uniref:Major facilitator superfamily domain-containing protein n=1 Tax=Lentinula aciculospora TaxID=153920 RepID=A0A9W9ADG1_9AGAR|nr:major facilitator superfamily domain-containing protein [Lentinula aciculospora]